MMFIDNLSVPEEKILSKQAAHKETKIADANLLSLLRSW